MVFAEMLGEQPIQNGHFYGSALYRAPLQMLAIWLGSTVIGFVLAKRSGCERKVLEKWAIFAAVNSLLMALFAFACCATVAVP